MDINLVTKIKENLRNFNFDIAFPMILKSVEDLIQLPQKMDTGQLNELLLLINEAMENKDVIRLCDITEHILYPQFIETNTEGQ